ALIDALTAALPSPPLPPLPPSLYIPPSVNHRDDVPESELPPHKRLCLSTLDSRYEIRESFTARPTRGRGVDYGFVSTVDAEARRVTEPAELHERNIQDLYALLEDAQDVWVVEEEAYASPKAWVHLKGLSQVTHQELQTHPNHVYVHATYIQAQLQLQLHSTLIQTQHQPGPDARIPDHHNASRDTDSHIYELLLLRNCVGFAKLSYALRTCYPLYLLEAQVLFDQACHSPNKLGGLGILSAGDIIQYAFLASRLQTSTLQTKILMKTAIESQGSSFKHALGVFNTTCNLVVLSVTGCTSAPHMMKTLAKCYFGVIEKDLVSKYSLSPRQVAILSCFVPDS
ncbi:hypothetical protein Tco_1527199, partial [Tanacetum coccineum]